MAELIPYSVTANLVNNLASSAVSEFGKTNDVIDDLEELVKTIECIQRVLPAVEEVQEKEGDNAVQVQLWLTRLKDVLHAADDLVDDIATENLRFKKDSSLWKKVRNRISFSFGTIFRHQMVHEIKKIRNDVDSVARDMLNLDVSRLNLYQSHESTPREKTSFVLESNIIGREDSIKEILSQLMQPHGKENVSLIGIVGIGGIGKTTIAEMVYINDQVKGFFEKRAWVSVSDNSDVETTVKKILESLTSSKSNDQESFAELLNKLDENLNGKKYFLVLDDIWNESDEKWSQLITCLNCGAQGSKILVTTCSKIVAEVMGVSFSFYLQGLTEEQSWDLFKKLVFIDDDSVRYPKLESVGKKIATECRGVPQIIETVTDMLSKIEYEETKWIQFLEGMHKDPKILMPALKLSYQHLSPELKQCFAYCCIYPKEWEIEKNVLIQLWMALGYLECFNEEQQMEDVGNKYVETLRKRSFFQEEKSDEFDNLVSFKMHDLMRDLALLVAGNDCYFNGNSRANKPMHMRISLESNAIDLLGSLDASRLQTFFLQKAGYREISQLTGELSVIMSFKSLRVLKLSHYPLKKLPDSIEKLKHLRYLDLSWCVKLASLPKSIGNLVNLQTLKLTGCETLEFPTEVVTELTNLRHLEIHRCKAFEDMMPAGLGKLSSLQSLSSFYVVDADQNKKAGKLNELQNLNNLRGNLEINTLGLVSNVLQESKEVNLKEKKLLETLDLNWGCRNINNDSSQLLENLCPHQHLKRLNVWWYPGVSFCKWLSSIMELSYISLFGFDNCEYLPPLELLPNLKSLEIGSMTALEYIQLQRGSSTAAKFFPSLKRLKFSDCEKFQGWKRMENDVSPHHLSLAPFSCLSQLIINKCPKLNCMPTFPDVEKLQLCESAVAKPLRETLDIASSSSTPLSMLKSLKIEGKLLDIKDLPSQWVRNLTSLEYLEIGGVEKLEIWFLDLDCFPSLRKIMVYDCELQALPDVMCNSLSLKHIKLMGCRKLASLPEGMPRLTNLAILEIWDCPLLFERCQRETGVDWPKISHVQTIVLKQNDKFYRASPTRSLPMVAKRTVQ